jgi:hypothetical protein
VRPGRAADGSLLVPLAKSPAGEEAPLFAIEVVCLASAAAWPDRGRALVSLPAADLTISRTGVTIHYPPLYRVVPAGGAFRVQPFEAPGAPVLRDNAAHALLEAPRSRPATNTGAAAQALAENYRPPSAAGAGRALLPRGLTFPEVGPSVYLVSELTEESKAPSVELEFQKQGGAQ